MEAVEIVRLDTGSPCPLLEVNEGALNDFLKSVDPNAIVVSIVGPLQSGKSFLMNFASRYLKSLEEDRQESWMYQDSPVRGFRFQPSTTVVTRGISILPQAFRINNRPVYLIDTRGVFDEETSLREWAGIVGTCLAVSTCTIFNVQTLLHDESLIYLDSFIEYGKILSKNISRDGEAMKIGNLVFLVRDWNNPSEFDYGSEGGQAFIMRKLSTENPGMTEEAKRVRTSVISAVRNISCYLMPHPGDTVNSVMYDRPLNQGALHGPFEQSLEHFMPTLFTSENLLNAGTNSVHRLAEFVQVFNNIFTSVKRTPDITAHLNYEMSVYQGVRFYEETQRRKLQKKSKLQPTYIDEHHGELKKYLLEMFQKRRQYGDQQLKAEYTAKLDEMLEKSRIRMKEEVLSEQEALAQQVQLEAISAVRSKLEELSVSETLSPSALEKKWTRAKEDVLTEQKTTLKKLGTDSRSKLQQNIESALLEVYEESQKRCQQQQEQVLAEHRDVLKESIKKYEEKMEIISDSYASDARFDRIHQTSVDAAMKNLGNNMKVPDDAPEMKHRILETFNQLIKTARARLEKTNQEHLDSFNSFKMEVIEKALESFQQKAEKVVQSSDSVERKIRQLKEFRSESQEDALGKVEELDDVPAELLRLSKTEIKDTLEKLLRKFAKEVEEKSAEQNSLAVEAVNDAMNKLKQTLQMVSEKIMKPDACATVLSSAKKDVIESVSKKLRNIGVTDPDKYLPQLNPQIDIALELASQQNQSSYQAMVENLRVAMETSFRQFTDAVEGLKREERKGGDTSSVMRTEEARALESYEITVEPLHYPEVETVHVRDCLRWQLETKRKEYEKYFLEQSQQSQEEMIRDMIEKAEGMIEEKLTSYSKGIQILPHEVFVAYWKKARDAVVIQLELDLMSSKKLAPLAATDMIEKVRTVLAFDSTWQKRLAVNQENEEKIRRSMERFVEDFKDKTKDISRVDHASGRRITSKKNSVLTDFRLSFTCTNEEDKIKLTKEMEEKLDQVIEELEAGEPMDYTELAAATALCDSNMLENDRPTQIVSTNGICANPQRVQHESLQGSEFISQSAPARNHEDYESAPFERLLQRMLSQFKATTPQGLRGISRASIPMCLRNFDKDADLLQLKGSPLYEVYRNRLEKDLEAFCREQNEQQNLQAIGPDISSTGNISRRLPTRDLDDIKDKVARFYRGAMDAHFQTPSYYQTQRLTEFHTTACSEAKDQMHRSLDPEDMKEVQAMLDQIFKQYEAKNQMNTPTSFAIGIDLGTTYSCVGVYINGTVEIIANSDRGQKTTPSYVSFDKDNKPVVGEAAKEQAHLQPERTAYEVKRLIGRRLDDPAIQEDLKKWPFKVVNERGAPKVLIGEKTYHPEEISALLLEKLRIDAEDYVGDEVKYAVITVPAYFTEGQRNATKSAGQAAGLHVLRIINEPTAAAIAYKLKWNKDQKPIKGLVYDFGGGTFDVAIFEANKGEIKIVAVGGDTHLGGADFDNEMVNHCIQKFTLAEGMDLEEGKETPNGLLAVNRRKMRMKGMCEKGKKGLSGASETTISVECIYGSKDLNVKIRRAEFEAMIDKHVAKSLECVEKTLRDANLRKQDIEEIILIGGSTRIPKVRMALTEYFGRPVNFGINPDEAVAYGAAFEAAVLNGARAQRDGDIRSAAIAPIGMSIKDVTPMSLGIEIDGGDMSVLIPRQSQVPTEVFHTYMTAYNNQTSVQIVIWEGEKPKAAENTQVAEFYLNGIPPAKAGAQRIRVTMKVNHEGIITVTAVCIENGMEKSLTVRDNKKRLTKKDRGG